ncbi:MAG: zf-HC2 domain-containing protein [Acidobacteria bacterium]|nr:zf-HC2 domain-containing protein [Acidobacteriota bacterium]
MMHAVSCEAVQDRLEEFHDDELALEARVAIQGHLRDCVTCALVAAELEEVRESLRDMAQALPDRTAPEAERLSRRVVERVRVEAQFSWRAEVRALFQDMHLVWAALGATAATLVCLAGSVSVLHAASQERPDSLAGLITLLANPGSNENPVRLDSRMLAPRSRTDAETFAPLTTEDAVLALSAVVTREGRVQNLELLRSSRALDVKVRPDVLLAMLDAAARMEFEPAQAGGAPVAVSMVWVLASTTVKGSPTDDVVLIRRRVTANDVIEGPVPPKSVAPVPVVARPTTDDLSVI